MALSEDPKNWSKRGFSDSILHPPFFHFVFPKLGGPVFIIGGLVGFLGERLFIIGNILSFREKFFSNFFCGGPRPLITTEVKFKVKPYIFCCNLCPFASGFSFKANADNF